MTRPVVIIGAGVAGLGAAWELARRGVEVTVLERDQPGRGASGAAAGMLAPVAEAKFGEPGLVDLAVESFGMWPAFRRSLEAASGTDLDYRDEGTLVVAVDQDDLAALEHVHRYHADRGLDSVIIDGEDARALEPGLAPSIPGAVHCRSDHQVDPRRMLDALSKAFTAAGGKLLTGVEVTAVVSDDGVANGLTTDGDWKAPPEACFVLAAGAWSRKIAGLDADRPAVRPVRGQMIAVELGGPPICRHVIRAPDAYMVPKSDGRLLIGSTMEEMGFDERLTAGGLMDILTGAWEALPGIHELRVIDTWTGLRPVSLDNEPILRKSKLDRLWYATGHGRNGILLTPLSAQRVADMLMEEI